MRLAMLLGAAATSSSFLLTRALRLPHRAFLLRAAGGTRLSASGDDNEGDNDDIYRFSAEPAAADYRSGMSIRAKVLQFGPLGATVSIDGGRARGLVLQREIAMLRDRRGGTDVVRGEELEAWVARVREDGRVNVSLRPIGVDRISSIKAEILEALEGSPDGVM